MRNFHKKFYRPENLTIILAGQIEAQDVFKALEVVEDDIISKVNIIALCVIIITLQVFILTQDLFCC